MKNRYVRGYKKPECGRDHCVLIRKGYRGREGLQKLKELLH